jgi:hypothetical protein
LIDERSRNSLDVAERFAEGFATTNELGDAHAEAWQAYHDIEDGPWPPAGSLIEPAMHRARFAAAHAVGWVTQDDDPRQPYTVRSRVDRLVPALTGASWEAYCAGRFASGESDVNEYSAQVVLFRDIIGPLPFRPVAFAPTLLTSLVTGLAQAIYGERAFERMPILADALEEAGCTDAEVLAHCRGSGPHVRGCWVVDLILAES